MAINPQNVNQLVNFFKDNQKVPLESLKKSALSTGYSTEDVDAAVNTVGMVTTTQPTTAGTAAKKPSPKAVKVLLVSVAAVAGIGAILAGGYALSRRADESAANKQTTRVVANKDQGFPTAFPTIATVVSIPPTPTEVPLSPLSRVKVALAAKPYKVDTQGKLQSDEASSSANQKTTLDLTGATFYLKNGDVIRADLREQGNRQSLLLTNNTLLFVEYTGETYTQLNTPGKLISDSPYYAILRYSFPILGLIEAQDQGKLIWQKISDNEWITEWAYPLLTPKNASPYQVKMHIDTKTDLVDTFSLKTSSTASWQEITIAYTPLDTIEPYLIIPKSFKKVALGAPTSTPTPVPTVKP